jgi:hypothetical protein
MRRLSMPVAILLGGLASLFARQSVTNVTKLNYP